MLSTHVLHEANSNRKASNAEAGIGLICTCLPATAALINKAKARTGYGSSTRAYGNHMSGAHKLSNLSSSHATKDRQYKNLEAGSDEAGLVSHAQGQSGSTYDPMHGGGIMRKVEVMTHISYMNSEEDEDQKTSGSSSIRK